MDTQTQSPGAIRVSRWRERQRSGLIILSIEIDASTVAGLITEGLLHPNDTEDREAIAKALKGAVSRWLISRGL
jgi:hypothetical protein